MARGAVIVRIGAGAVIAILTGGAKTAFASPVDTYGFESRSTALGGAVAADAADVSANYYNPAALVGAKGLMLDLGYVRAWQSLKMNGRDNRVDPFRALTFGLVAPGEIGALPFAFGVALHLPDDRIFRVRSLDQQQPRWEMFDNRTQRIFFATNLAIRPTSWLEIGGGLSFLSGTRVRLDITGAIDIAQPRQSTLRHEVDADLTSIRYPQVGVRVTPHKRLHFGAVYRGEFQLDLDIEARLAVQGDFVGARFGLLSMITTKSVNAFLPQQVAFGASYELSPEVTLDAGVTWVNWSAYKPPVTRVKADAKFDVPAGFPVSLLPESPAPTVVVAPEFRDRFVPRVGVEGRIPFGAERGGHELALRAGYFFERSPVPEQRALTNYVDADRHAVSAGLGLKLVKLAAELPAEMRLDAHAMLSLIPERTMRKSSAADLVGDYRAGGHVWAVGTTIGMVFR